MAPILSFTIEGGEALEKGLVILQEKLQDLRPFWRDVWAPKYFAKVQDAFATGGRARGGGGKFKGGAWAGLSPAYRVWKKVHYPNQPILVRDGGLRESLRWDGVKLGVGGIFDARTDHVIAGTTVAYAKYHQHGTGKMPARPFMPDPNFEGFSDLLMNWLLKPKAGA